MYNIVMTPELCSPRCVLLWTPMFAPVFLYSVKTEVLQWTDLRHIFMTTSPEWSASRPGCSSAPGKEPPLPIVQEAGWAPVPVWTQRLEGL
jgi:hypothetical protein